MIRFPVAVANILGGLRNGGGGKNIKIDKSNDLLGQELLPNMLFVAVEKTACSLKQTVRRASHAPAKLELLT